MKRYLVVLISLMLLLPTLAQAKGFSGGHSSFHSSRSTISLSKSSPRTYSSSSRSYSSRSYTSRTYRSTSVVHHYHYYEPSPFHYYNGFTTGMMLGSLTHPQGQVYYVNGQYQQYGPSPISWVVDVVIFILFILFVWWLFRKLI